MNTFGDVKAQTRGLLGDPQGQLASDSYLAPLVNVAYSLEVLALKNATGQNLEGVVLLPGGKALGQHYCLKPTLLSAQPRTCLLSV